MPSSRGQGIAVEHTPGTSEFDVIPARKVRLPDFEGGPASLGVRAVFLREGVPPPENMGRACIGDARTGFPTTQDRSLGPCHYIAMGVQPDGGIDCKGKPTVPGTDMVFFFADRPEVRGTVSLSNDPNAAAGLVRVVVEPGERPLHVVVSLPPQHVVWVEGAVERVVRLTAMQTSYGSGYKPMPPSAGVVGLPGDRFENIVGAACPQYAPGSSTLAKARVDGALANAFGKAPDKTFAQVTVGQIGQVQTRAIEGISLPTGRIVGLAGLRQAVSLSKQRWVPPMHMAFRVAVVVPIDPADVRGRAAIAVPVIPGTPGLAQLVEQGALAKAPGSGLEFDLVRETPLPVLRDLPGAKVPPVTIRVDRAGPYPTSAGEGYCLRWRDTGEPADVPGVAAFHCRG